VACSSPSWPAPSTRVEEPCTRGELLACAHRLFRAVSVIQQVTTTGHFLRAVDERVNEREERLRSFNRMVSHELKNRIGAVLGAGQLLRRTRWPPTRRPARFTRIVVDNAEGMQALLENLISLSRTDDEVRQQRHVLLPEAVAEVVRQLREMARARGVDDPDRRRTSGRSRSTRRRSSSV
jgi:signal transduction histidine kinase